LPRSKTRKQQGSRRRLRPPVAVITGAGRGIGLAIARLLAAEGCDLVLTGRKLPPLEKAGIELTRLGSCVLAKVCDVRDPESVEALAASVKKQFGRVDVLINNAGIAHPSLPVEKLSYADWKAVIDTNLTGIFLVSRAILALMSNGGTIVNNLSIAAKRVFSGWSAYNASKHGALGLTNTLREELRPRGIRVIALLPGATDTDIWDTPWPDAPRRNMMSAETVAQALLGVLALPVSSAVEELRIMPTAGAL
jgi:NAD(P)-dependent dehydrogenase (short-subunit alcohol dehydrogenase family)